MENFITTTELSKKYGRVSSTVISFLKKKGYEPKDIVINSHHQWIWPIEAYKEFDNIKSEDEFILLDDYAKELGIEKKTLIYFLRKHGRNGVTYTTLSKKIEDDIKSYFSKKPEPVLNKADHPLVKDDRFFDINYWPETVPKCFEDLD